ncbi:hypothetical protein [Chitinophaga sp. CB10]|uniref:hypothetical protein n=1 Tax=Chitinophaga sp. CB10 TaxID=1891659 RepID=UPI0025BAA1F6|nr:hypothetical protein [Chitinophaga sp. CB10]
MLLLAAFLSLFFVNSILSLYLQRSLLIPQFNLKESTPSGIKITGGIILFFTTIWIIRAVQLIVTAKTGVEAMREQVAALNEELAKTISSELLVGTGIIILAFSALFFSNALLGIIYLKKWKKQQEEQHNHYPDDDNLQL